jgi:hypothetical protein
MATDSNHDRHSPLKKRASHLHSEAELEQAAQFAMEHCPDVIAMMRNNTPWNEAGRLAALSQLNRALQIALPSITLVEMADVALFIAMKLHPLSESDQQHLDEMLERSIKSRDAIKKRNAHRNKYD